MFSPLHSVTNDEHNEKDLCQSRQKTQMIPVTNVGKSSRSATTNQHLALSAKINGTQRRMQVSP